jgi:hypothetical protein
MEPLGIAILGLGFFTTVVAVVVIVRARQR